MFLQSRVEYSIKKYSRTLEKVCFMDFECDGLIISPRIGAYVSKDALVSSRENPATQWFNNEEPEVIS